MTQSSLSNTSKHLTFRYRNWRGQVATRVVMPESIWYGTSEWHPESQWFLRAIDAEKGEVRDFAFADIEFASDTKS